MRYLALLAAITIVYVVLSRQSPVDAVKEAVTQTEAAPLSQGSREQPAQAATSLKRPFDRTHDALDLVKTRNGTGEF